MPSLSSVIADISKLPISDKEQILNFLEEVVLLGSYAPAVVQEVKENRFSKGKVCPYCGHEEVSRNGKYNGKQRYICKNSECGKTFTDFTRSPIYNSKKALSKWLQYAKCMVDGYSIRKCAEIVDINIATAFFWRHKMLDAIRSYMGIGSVGGIIEVDETFFAESFKGNHKRSRTFTMPRKARKRGKEVKVRGISHEQVCVVCALDRVGNMVTELVCKGRIKHNDLERLFTGRIENNSILCTDSHKSYIKFASDFGLEHYRIKRGRHMEGIYHIQHINAFHSKLKGWMYKFHGVATKYLANYMYWFKWIELFNTEKEIIKGKDLLVHSSIVHTDTRIRDFKIKLPVFV